MLLLMSYILSRDLGDMLLSMSYVLSRDLGDMLLSMSHVLSRDLGDESRFETKAKKICVYCN